MKQSRVLNSVTDIVKFYLIVSPSAATAQSCAFSSDTHQCYQVLGALHAVWPQVPGSIKDYISTPKQNGYQGLHSSLLTIGCTKVGAVEIIVHTKGMHQRANYGIAAEAWPRPLPPPPRRGAADSGHSDGGWDPLGLKRIFHTHLGNGGNGSSGAETRPAVAVADAPGLERAYNCLLYTSPSPRD